MGEASGEGAIYPGGGARESLNGLCGEVEMTIHGKPQVMRAHPHRSEGRTEGGNEGVEGGGIVGGRGREAKERLRPGCQPLGLPHKLGGDKGSGEPRCGSQRDGRPPQERGG